MEDYEAAKILQKDFLLLCMKKCESLHTFWMKATYYWTLPSCRLQFFPCPSGWKKCDSRCFVLHWHSTAGGGASVIDVGMRPFIFQTVVGQQMRIFSLLGLVHPSRSLYHLLCSARLLSPHHRKQKHCYHLLISSVVNSTTMKRCLLIATAFEVPLHCPFAGLLLLMLARESVCWLTSPSVTTIDREISHIHLAKIQLETVGCGIMWTINFLLMWWWCWRRRKTGSDCQLCCSWD